MWKVIIAVLSYKGDGEGDGERGNGNETTKRFYCEQEYILDKTEDRRVEIKQKKKRTKN